MLRKFIEQLGTRRIKNKKKLQIGKKAKFVKPIGDDPIAKLARIIGRNHKNDFFLICDFEYGGKVVVLENTKTKEVVTTHPIFIEVV